MDSAALVGLLKSGPDTELHAQAEFLGGTAESRGLSEQYAFPGDAGRCFDGRGGLG